MKRACSTFGAVFAAGLLVACAAAPPKPNFPQFGAVEIRTETTYEGGNEAQTAGRRAAAGAAVGVAGGAAYGAVMGALACGPFFLACLPVAVGIGAATGGVVGAAGASMGAVSKEEAEALNGLMAGISIERDLNEFLRQTLISEIPNAAEARNSTDAIAFVSILAVLFVKNDQDLVLARVVAQMSVTLPEREAQAREWTAENAADAPAQQRQTLRYQQDSDARSLDDWLKDNGRSLSLSLEHVLQLIASQMATELGQSPAPDGAG